MIIPGFINVQVYKIKFKYLTKRNNQKEREVLVKANSEFEAKKSFWIWIQDYNEKFSYRAYLNVSILSVCNSSTELIKIE